MVMVLQQDIPSDQLIHYRRSLIPAVDPVSRQYGTQQFHARKYGPPESLLYKNKYGDNYYHARPYGTELYPHLARASTSAQMSFVRKRMPHFWPRMRNDSPFSPSAAQRKVREAFKRCVDCFNIQPWSGGAEPDGIGPYSRTWWYEQAGPSGLWYYNYFIATSWFTFFTGNTPKWCILSPYEDTHVRSEFDNTNFCTANNIFVHIETLPYDQTWIYIRTNPTYTPTTLHIYQYERGFSGPGFYPIGVYEVLDKTYDPCSITWNSKPNIGTLLHSFTAHNTTGWHSLAVKKCPSVCIKYIAPEVPVQGDAEATFFYSYNCTDYWWPFPPPGHWVYCTGYNPYFT